MERIVSRCEATGTWLLADEVYLGAEIDARAHAELLGHERSRDRHERSFEGLRDSRRPHRLDRRPDSRSSADCWAQHDYLTIGPNKMSDRLARVAVEAAESRALLRAHARHPQPQPAHRPRVDRPLRRPAHVARAAGRRHRARPLRRRHPEPRRCRARARQPEHAHRPRHRTSGSRAISGSGSAAARSSSAKASGRIGNELTPLFD